jgi:digeranylgeranylglycerophospholipid reductase
MPQTASSFDLVIVGASFAGLVAARTAAMRGLRVAVIDAKREAGHRVATTGILVKEAAEEFDVPHRFTRRVHGVRLYAPNLTHIDLFAPGYFFLTTDTAGLLRWLADEAERAGARTLWNARFNGGVWEGDVFRFGGLNIGARYVLGADGVRSSVARFFGLGRNSQCLTGVEAEYEDLNRADPRFLHCFLDSKLAPGYIAWVATGPHAAQVGLAVGPGRRPKLAPFLARTEPLLSFSKARVIGHRAGRIPCGGLVAPWAGPGVMLIGDAAGVVSPATGGGIRYAFRFGRRAGQAIADHLQHLGPRPDVVLAAELPRFTLKRGLRLALDLAPPNMLMSAVLRSKPVGWLAQHIYFHRRGASELSFAEFEARLTALTDTVAVPTTLTDEAKTSC